MSMPTKPKSASADNGNSEHINGHSQSPETETQPMPMPSLWASSLPPPPPDVKKPTGTKNEGPPPPPPSQQQVLVICRNKHWRYISSFHGPWLQLPPEILETMANFNYNTPRPRPIDPAVFFDLVKIRRLVDEATDLAVRAASGVATIGHRSLPGASPHAAALGLDFGFRPALQTKLSSERKHRMREQATQKLVKAYRLDEIACSVATMQSASSLEEVASLVLQRNAQDPDAKYVHFFHEKIPSRQLADCTSLAPLNEIIAARPSAPEPLRTRAMVRVFKGDYEGAIDDLTDALRLHRLYRPALTARKSSSQETQISERQGNGWKTEDVTLKDEDQPSSLEMQLLFQRAGVYLTIACRHVPLALPEQPLSLRESAATQMDAANGHHGTGPGGDGGVAGQGPELELSLAEKEARSRMAEARKLVRHNAKRALRDYTAYLSHFEYSPDLPIEIAEGFTRKVNYAVNGARMPRSPSYPPGSRSPAASEGVAGIAPYRIYALSDLFTSSPPSGLPPYPSMELASLRHQQPPSPGPVRTTTETLTCHPLLTDALHALLLCHCLIQTSAKELLRHAYMVARLARLADGYPVFQSSRCPARTDWVEVLRAAGNWIQLAGKWEDLCAPAPLPLFQSTGSGTGQQIAVSLPPLNRAKALPTPRSDSAATSPESPPPAVSGDTAVETENLWKDDIQRQAAPDADRVEDDPPFHMAIRARQLRAEHDYRIENAVAALDAKLARGGLKSPLATMSDGNNSTQPPTAPALHSTTTTAGSQNQSLAPTASSSSSSTTAGTTNINTNSTSTSISNGEKTAKPSPSPAAAPTPRSRPAFVDHDCGHHYPMQTERASAVARWVLEAPLPSAAGSGPAAAGDGARSRRKKKTAAKKQPVAASVGTGTGTGTAKAKADADVRADDDERNMNVGSGSGETG